MATTVHGTAGVDVSADGDVIRISKLRPAQGDDPRDIVYIPVGRILIDDRTQRNLDAQKLDRMKRTGRKISGDDSAVLWELVEGLTLAERDDGRWVAIEGQHRVMTILDENGPDARVWALVAPGGRLSEARIAYLIAVMRTAHTPYERYEQRLRDQEPYAVAIDTALSETGLYAADRNDNSPGSTSVGVVATLDLLAHKAGTPDDGQQLVARTLSVMLHAFAGQSGVWKSALVRAVGEVICRNEGIDLQRLHAKLSQSTAASWEAIADLRRARVPAYVAIAREIVEAYNQPRSYSRPVSW